MTRKTRFVTLCFLFLIVNGCSQSGRPAYSPPNGEFSFVPPENWAMREMPGFKYQFAFGPATNKNFSPNINFVDQSAPFKLDEFVAGNLATLHHMAANEGRSLEIITEGEFITDSKRSGVRVVTETTYDSNPVRQTFYFFEGKDNIKFVITCTWPADEGQSYDKMCDSSIRTFKPRD
jgi:hypothetical protein